MFVETWMVVTVLFVVALIGSVVYMVVDPLGAKAKEDQIRDRSAADQANVYRHGGPM